MSAPAYDAARSKCLSPRCGLCYQPFVENDRIVIGYKQHHSAIYSSHRPFTLANGVEYVPWCSAQQADKIDQAIASHDTCFQHISPDVYVELLKIAKRSFLSDGREKRLVVEGARSFKKPQEWPENADLGIALAIEISQHLTREYAVAALLSLHQYGAELGETDVDVSAPIVSGHIVFEGRYYMNEVTNAQGPSHRQPPKLLLILEDELGIKDLKIARSELPPSIDPVPGAWWKTVALRQNNYMIKLQSDGRKFRSVEYQDKSTRKWPLWSVPRIASSMRKVNWCSSAGPGGPIRMVRCSYNMAETTGLSIRCAFGPAAWFSHGKDVDLSCYATDTAASVWIYIPLHNERITALWRRQPILPFDLALALETDQGRCFLVGTQGAQGHAGLSWSLLDTPNAQPSNLFFDSDPMGPRCISFETPAPNHRRLPAMPRPLSTPPPSSPTDRFYWSSAPLKDVSTVRQCVRTDHSVSRVIGLLFEYSDGAKAAVGQVRLDSMMESQNVDDLNRLWLEVQNIDGRLPFISQIKISETPMSGVEWLGTRWDGALEWWFSPHECRVWYSGQESL